MLNKSKNYFTADQYKSQGVFSYNKPARLLHSLEVRLKLKNETGFSGQLDNFLEILQRRLNQGCKMIYHSTHFDDHLQ